MLDDRLFINIPAAASVGDRAGRKINHSGRLYNCWSKVKQVRIVPLNTPVVT